MTTRSILPLIIAAASTGVFLAAAPSSAPGAPRAAPRGGSTPDAPVAFPDTAKFILTPPPPEAPRINGAPLFAVRPNHPILFRIPATGVKPITFAAIGVPEGARLDPATGQLSGMVATEGTYKITLTATNAKGTIEKPFRLVVGEAIGLTPPMGWNSYNCWGSTIDESKILRSANAMVATGLIDHGWTYINMDDGWQGQRGGPLNALQPDTRAFPDMKKLADSVHALGLKVGIYHSPWVTTYAGRVGGSSENAEGAPQRFPGNPPKNAKQLPFAIGRFKFTTNDSKQFQEWGIDYLKYDWGPVEYPETKEMNDALQALNRDIFFSISNNHVKNLFKDIANVSTVCNAWRTTTDITDNWGRVSNDIGFAMDPWAPFARPGHYNDCDMLVVGRVGLYQGLHFTKLTPDEQFTHITMWCMLSSPLLIGCDMEHMDPFTLSLLTNDEVLAVDQDPLVKPAVSVSRQGQLEVYRKELEDGSLGVGLFNRGGTEAPVTARWSDLKLTGKQNIRDLWRQQDVAASDSGYTTTVKSHGTAFIRITPAR